MKKKYITLLIILCFICFCDGCQRKVILNNIIEYNKNEPSFNGITQINLDEEYSRGISNHLIRIENKLIFLGFPWVGANEKPKQLDLDEYDLSGKLLLSKQLFFSIGKVPYTDMKIALNSENLFIACPFSLNEQEGILVTRLANNYVVVWTKFLSFQEYNLILSDLSVNDRNDVFLSGTFSDKNVNTTKCFTIQINEKEIIIYKQEIYINKAMIKFNAMNLHATVVDKDGNLFFVGWTESLGKTSLYNALGFVGKISKEGKLVFLKGIMKSNQEGITQFKNIQLLTNNNLLLTGISGYGGLFLMECNLDGEIVKVINIKEFPSTFMPNVTSYKENLIIIQTIVNNKQEEEYDLIFLNLTLNTNQSDPIQTKRSFNGLGKLYEDILLKSFFKKDTMVIPLMQSVKKKLFFLNFDTSGRLLEGDIDSEEFTRPMSCKDITKEVFTEDWFSDNNIVKKTMNIECKNLKDMILLK